MTNSARWIKISKDEAKKHELYGAGGWLLVFAFALLLGLLAQLGQARSLAHDAGMDLSELFGLDLPIVGFLKLNLGAQFLQTVVVYWMLVAKPTIFRQATTWLLVATGPVVVAAQLIGNPFPSAGSIAVEAMLPWIISSTVWVVYLNQSLRVRVTFEHKIRTDKTTIVDPPPSSPAGSRKRATSLTSNNNTPALTVSHTPELAAEERHWAQALAEFDGPDRRPGVWARSFVQAQGDETKAKAFYLAVRAEQIALDRNDDFQHPQEGTCPNCAATLMLTVSECPHCKADFRAGASWAPIPVRAPAA